MAKGSNEAFNFIVTFTKRGPFVFTSTVILRNENMDIAFRPVLCMISDSIAQMSLPVSGFRMVDVSTLRYFTFKKLIYLWYPDENRFTSIHSLDVDVSLFYSVTE